MVGLAKYAVASSLATIGVIYHAYYTREQFYPAMLFLSSSKISLTILGNMALVLTLLFGQLLKTIFLGSLREAEVERLYELARNEIMETCLAMTIFRDEFDWSFLAMFTALLFIKIFHWLAQKRIEYIETTPSVSRLSHIRIISFLVVLILVDCIFLHHAATHAYTFLKAKNKPSVLVLFAFEYLILVSSAIVTFWKYCLYAVEVVMDGQWDNKAVYVFYLEFVKDLLHLFVYLVFFLIVFAYYGLPLHLARDLYETFRSFRARISDFIKYRRITSNLNDRFVDATAEELGRGDATCIICREEMTAAKKLPCGHLFHVHCLRSWLERQQTCPTCRCTLLPSENDPVPNNGNVPQAQPMQPGAEGEGQANGQIPGQPNLIPQYFGANYGVNYGLHYGANYGYDVQAQMQAALAQLHMAGNWYPAYNQFLHQHQQNQQNQQNQHQHQHQHFLHQPPLAFAHPPVIPPANVNGNGNANSNINGTVNGNGNGNGIANGSAQQPSNMTAGNPDGNPSSSPSPSPSPSPAAPPSPYPSTYPSLSPSPSPSPSPSEILAARLQMQTAMASLLTVQAQAQAQLAMGGYPYGVLNPYYTLYGSGGVPTNQVNWPRTGEEGQRNGEGNREAGNIPGPPGSAGLAEMMMQWQQQAMNRLQTQSQNFQNLPSQNVTSQNVPQNSANNQSGINPTVVGGSQQPAQDTANASTVTNNHGNNGMTGGESSGDSDGTVTKASLDSSSSAGSMQRPVDPAEEEREKLRRRRLQRYGGDASSSHAQDS